MAHNPAGMRMETRRAPRLLLSVPISYRVAGDDHWLAARVRNISETGLMFAPADLRVGQDIEVILSSPIAIQSIGPGQLLFNAKIVRTEPDNSAAAEFAEYRFLLSA
jgi:PilZ domain